MRFLPLLLILSACAQPDAPAPPDAPAASPADTSFDAAAWMERAAPVWDSTSWSAAYDSTLSASRQLAAELDAAVHWMTTCDLPADEQADSTSGIMHRYPLGPNEHLISISCELYPYQATFVIVHVGGRRARLVEAPQFDETGAVADTSALFVGLESVDASTRSLSNFTRARGPGDCGTLATYRVGADGSVRT